jgi:hypothetical protein
MSNFLEAKRTWPEVFTMTEDELKERWKESCEADADYEPASIFALFAAVMTSGDKKQYLAPSTTKTAEPEKKESWYYTERQYAGGKFLRIIEKNYSNTAKGYYYLDEENNAIFIPKGFLLPNGKFDEDRRGLLNRYILSQGYKK